MANLQNVQFTYPSSAELREISEYKADVLMRNNPIFEVFPMTYSREADLIWEQADSAGGLMMPRGLDGAPSRVKRVGSNLFMAQPGTYGEVMVLREAELTRRAQLYRIGEPVNIDDLIMRDQDQLEQRRVTRWAQLAWELALNGTFSVYRDNILLHQDQYQAQTFTATVPWSTRATATPIADLQTVALLDRGLGVLFGTQARLYMNRKTAANLTGNLNAADLYGQKINFNTIVSIDQVNTIFLTAGLPQVVVFDDSYTDNNGVVQQFIPDGKALLVGYRPGGEQIGEWRLTHNINTEDGTGIYQKVIDRGADGSGTQVPRSIEIHDGFNGGPIIFYPKSLVVLNI